MKFISSIPPHEPSVNKFLLCMSVACQQQNHQPGPAGQGCLQENLVSRRRGVLAFVDVESSVGFYCTLEWMYYKDILRSV